MNTGLWYRCGQWAMRIYTKVCFKKHVVAHTSIPKGPKIIVANHPSSSDPFIFTTLFNQHAALMIYGNHFRIPVFGSYLRLSGHIPVFPDKGKEALMDAYACLQRGQDIIMFIEGGLSREGSLEKPKTGAVRLALMSGAPIIPVGVSIRSSHLKSWNLKVDQEIDEGKWYIYGPYAMTIGAPLFFSGNVEERARVVQLTQYVSEIIQSCTHESTDRLDMLSHWVWRMPYAQYAYRPMRWAYHTLRNVL